MHIQILEPIQRVQVRRCDEAGGLGGAGGWTGGCPFGARGGLAWQVVFDGVYYDDDNGLDRHTRPGFDAQVLGRGAEP